MPSVWLQKFRAIRKAPNFLELKADCRNYGSTKKPNRKPQKAIESIQNHQRIASENTIKNAPFDHLSTHFFRSDRTGQLSVLEREVDERANCEKAA